MTAAQIRSHIVARPFRPFKLCLADGRQIPVVHHDFVMLSPNGRLVDVFQPDNSHSILDVFLILSVEVPPTADEQPNTSANGEQSC
jgi:hypothetical protein